MTTASGSGALFPRVGDGSFMEADRRIYREELQLALRNKAMPLEALRYERTPTGMHYTLIHYDIPDVDPSSWRLEVGGVKSLTLAQLQSMPAETVTVTMECAGDGRALTQPRSISQPWLYGAVGTAAWTGVPLPFVLEEAGLLSGAARPDSEVLFTGLDEGYEGGVRQRYQRSLPMEAATRSLLVWDMNGAPLEPHHGFPLRLVVPSWYGMASVKWLHSIELTSRRFEGYQQAIAYRYSSSREESGTPVEVMRVRSLMIPPGVPDYLTRTRVVDPGLVEITGRAWSGEGPITKVEFSCDGGEHWVDTTVEMPTAQHAWQLWRHGWDAIPGRHDLCCRATDSAGNLQPSDQFWTARGMGNNVIHRVPVIVGRP